MTITSISNTIIGQLNNYQIKNNNDAISTINYNINQILIFINNTYCDDYNNVSVNYLSCKNLFDNIVISNSNSINYSLFYIIIIVLMFNLM